MTRTEYLRRFARLFLGFGLCALSVAVGVQGSVGVSPWDVFHQGTSRIFGLSLGQSSIYVGFAILAIAVVLGETIGLGTIFNILGVGMMMDVILGSGLIPVAPNRVVGMGMLILSLVIMAFGSFFYIGSGLGCGPRDSMMSALAKRFPKVSVGVVRGAIEAGAVLCGWLMGGQAGLGTMVAMFGVGPIVQKVFQLMKFDLRGLKHESCIYTLKALAGRAAPAPAVETTRVKL